MNKLIYGKNYLENVVSVENHGLKTKLFIEKHGAVKTQEMPSRYWTLYNKRFNDKQIRLDGELYYKFMMDFNDQWDWRRQISQDKINKRDYYTIYNDKEQYLTRSGVTYYKGMNIDEVSVMAFDIETNGLVMNAGSKIFCVSAIFSLNGVREERVFEDPKEFFSYVQEKNPSILIGHNIFGFDLPYLDHVCNGIPIGRDGSKVRFAQRSSRVRKDQGQQYDYFNALCYGREIIDTIHLAYKVGQFKGYNDYSIKTIAQHEGIARQGRQYYDAGSIADYWDKPGEREKIMQYALDDTQEVLDYFYKVAPAYFYYNQTVPKSFQQIISGASGSQVNSVLVRSYIQDKHSIPKPSETKKFQGAISYGNHGIYKDVKKVDIASLYPSLILNFNIHDPAKDPKNHFVELVREFTNERLKNKQLAKDTGEKLYKDLEQSQKIMINSAYGFMGAKGLNFNSPSNAAMVTRLGRQALEKGIAWAQDQGFQIVNVDTDSFSYTGGVPVALFQQEIDDLNSNFPELIRWENDGFYEQFIVVKAKNYILRQGEDITIKGSSLKATTKERALKQFIDDVIDLMLQDKIDSLPDLYYGYVEDIVTINQDTIANWCSKKTITKKVLEPKRPQEANVLKAIQGSNYKEGDKVYVFFDTDSSLCLRENFKGDYDVKRLLVKLEKTLKIFETVLDVSKCPRFSLKKHEKDLEQLYNRLIPKIS